jgi:hypothetical protein
LGFALHPRLLIILNWPRGCSVVSPWVNTGQLREHFLSLTVRQQPSPMAKLLPHRQWKSSARPRRSRTWNNPFCSVCFERTSRSSTMDTISTRHSDSAGQSLPEVWQPPSAPGSRLYPGQKSLLLSNFALVVSARHGVPQDRSTYSLADWLGWSAWDGGL